MKSQLLIVSVAPCRQSCGEDEASATHISSTIMQPDCTAPAVTTLGASSQSTGALLINIMFSK